ncbi:MAG: heme ABC exporter ATP-binding protein CcmA [Pelagibacteraceae bacterium]|jgi:heme ABC exporter ATP-binding subunit CcmA|nr:heme ABC exporter ATP-binding protein CcmA [Pelagibacteraceae bacterium]HJL58459.1 heme ABC exporter ATP-binding protein CcmA [Alphaproteobacteria bacterium]MBO6466712.1 heme ABC exporter ATP-binding protein CcmA [Pelagibacteraceae bacterium]MBO6468358.1 heme ABC exporter ATP-binding protein CcmA [Pelagibacteraceae bacterium]MBO6469779.1 heme ABC exporter ATP-binding protein CcmA [Pelagibacteraceae bacterium]
MLLANNLSFKRGRKEIFQEMSISLPPKKIIHLKGRNGIGKTTFIKVLVNMLFPTTGEIYWNGKNIKKNLYEFFANLTYIMDIQTSKSELTVNENIRFWMKLFSSNIKSKQLEGIFDLLSLDKYKNTQVNFLSKGEIRKLELFRLVIEQKKLWILDEPYVGLDESTYELINGTFRNHIENNGMIFFSSHHRPELQNMDTINLENYANN